MTFNLNSHSLVIVRSLFGKTFISTFRLEEKISWLESKNK